MKPGKKNGRRNYRRGMPIRWLMAIDAVSAIPSTNLVPATVPRPGLWPLPDVIGAIPATALDQPLAAIENSPATTTIGAAAGISATKSDSSQLSPLGELISTLQQLQKTDPPKYAQVTQLIATNLQTASETAQKQGNSAEAKQLTAIAADFSSASKSGQISGLVQDLTQIAAGGQDHRGSAGASPGGSTTDVDNSNQLVSRAYSIREDVPPPNGG